MTRTNVLERIETIFSQKCRKCATRMELVKKYKSHFARQDGHCNKQCHVGAELQMLGKML